ncbi:MAG: hypothetical protein CUN56_14645 [Phototrophicales bacterium]|nr:MAG: hypothetical protein CUN56_14645 [Phototrophicales bacterium]
MTNGNSNAPRDTVSWYQSVAFSRWLDFKYRELGLFEILLASKPSSPALLPQGEGSVRLREMASEAMVHIARDLRQRQTPVEVILWECLRDRRLANIKFRRQHPVANTNYVVDFFSYEHKLVIELDGGIHVTQQDSDAQRQAELEALGLQVIRFTNEQVYTQLHDVLIRIIYATESPFALGNVSSSQAKSPFALREKGLGDEGKWQIRLPTEQEWQWVAQNGAENREYPWGDWDDYPRANTTEAGIGNRSTAVGMYPHGQAVCGALDMSGNLWEWCLNDYGNPEVTDGFGNGERKVLRGGAFGSSNSLARASSRAYDNPYYDGYGYGCRVVLSPK